MKFKYYTNKGFIYISFSGKGYYSSGFPNVQVNGQEPSETHHGRWRKIEGDTITSITELGPYEYTNVRFELDDPILESEDIPLSIPAEEAFMYRDEDDYEYYIGKPCIYYPYRNLYTYKRDTLLRKRVEVRDWEAVNLGEIVSLEVDKYSDKKFSVYKDTNWKHKGYKDVDLSSIAKYEDISQIMVPDLMIHTQPCSLSSPQTYEIIRKYVKENIAPKEARITSDYDFCFTVKKVVHVKPWTKRTEVFTATGKSYKRPKFKTSSVDTKLEEIFEMTHKGRNYQGYTPIEGFSGKNLKDLEEQIKAYLDELIEVINTPVAECQHCSGTGAVLKVFDKNLRKGDNT